MARRRTSQKQVTRQGLRCSNIEAIFATVHVVLTQGVFMTNYVLDLGSSNFICGVVESLPFFLQFTYFLSPILVRRLKFRKPVVVTFLVAHRLSWIFLILLLFLDMTPGKKQLVMLLTLLFANACAVIAGNAWFSWMTDLVPASIRGSYYGRRNVFLGITSMTTLLLGTQALTYFRASGNGRIGYTICFSVAIVSALFAAWVMSRQHEPVMKKPVPRMTLSQLYSAVQNNLFLQHFLKFFFFWQFSMGLAAAFFGVHMVKVLKMSPAQMGYQTLVASACALIGSRLWGRVMDRVGERAVVLACGGLISLHVWIWIPAQEGFLWPVWITSIAGGFFWAGYNIALFSWLQRICGTEERQYTYGLVGLVTGPAFVIGSLIGGTLTTIMPQTLFSIGTFEFLHFHLIFAISALGRGMAIQWMSTKSMSFTKNKWTVTKAICESFTKMRW